MEEQLQELHKKINLLEEEIEKLKARKGDEFVTSKELAEIMHCSKQTINNKIQSGEIETTKKIGHHRIPMSQFYNKPPIDLLKRKPKLRKVSGGDSMERLIFGDD